MATMSKKQKNQLIVVQQVFFCFFYRVQRTHKKETTSKETEKADGERRFLRTRYSSLAEDNLTESPQKVSNQRKSSVARIVGKILYNPNKKGMHMVDSTTSVATTVASSSKSEFAPHPSQASSSSAATVHNQFRFYRGHGSDYRVLQLSINSLLSIVSEFCLFYSRKGVVCSISAARRSSYPQSSRKVSMVCPQVMFNEAMTKVSLDSASVTVRENGCGQEGEKWVCESNQRGCGE